MKTKTNSDSELQNRTAQRSENKAQLQTIDLNRRDQNRALPMENPVFRTFRLHKCVEREKTRKSLPSWAGPYLSSHNKALAFPNIIWDIRTRQSCSLTIES
jgi:hypothetical protein